MPVDLELAAPTLGKEIACEKKVIPRASFCPHLFAYRALWLSTPLRASQVLLESVLEWHARWWLGLQPDAHAIR